MTQKSLLKRKHLRHFMYFIASKRGDSANGTADEILYRLPFSGAIIRSPAIHPRGIRNSWTIRDEKRKTLKKKKYSVAREEIFPIKFHNLIPTRRVHQSHLIGRWKITHSRSSIRERVCKWLPLRAGRLTREQPPRVFVVRCRPPLRKLRQQSHTGTRFLTNSLARPKTEEEEEKEEGEKASAGNKRRGRDKWRIDATVIYVDPLPAQPSLVVKEGTWWPCWGCVDTSLSADTYC